MSTRLLIVATEDAQAGYRLASSHPELQVVAPGDLLSVGPPRDIAASYFAPLADVLLAEPPLERTLAFPRAWPSQLPLAHRRSLQRTALALGGVVLTPPFKAQGPFSDLTLAEVGGATPTKEILGQITPLPGGPGGALNGAGLGPLLALGWANLGPGAGAYRPGRSIMLVGERSGTARLGELKHRLPFVTFAGAGCAPWLAEQLESIGIAESDLYWINAYDALNAPTEHTFLEDLRPRLVVALGKLAARWCSDAGIRYEEVPHPQYWKRFHYHERYRLLDVLKEDRGSNDQSQS